MKRFSATEDRSHVFDPHGEKDRAIEIQEGEWIDLYKLLRVAPDTSAAAIDEAIIERGADTVFFTFSGNGKPPHIMQLERYLPDMRLILLDSAIRRRYNEQLLLHQSDDPRAVSYADFVKTLDRREYSGCLAMMVPLGVLFGAGFLRFFAA